MRISLIETMIASVFSCASEGLGLHKLCELYDGVAGYATDSEIDSLDVDPIGTISGRMDLTYSCLIIRFQ